MHGNGSRKNLVRGTESCIDRCVERDTDELYIASRGRKLTLRYAFCPTSRYSGGYSGPGRPQGIAPLGVGKEVTSPPPPAPSERHVNLSVYAAQASLKVPRGTRWGAAHHLHDTGLELTSVTRRRPHQQASCCHLLCLPSQLLRRSRAETPEGSQPASRRVISPKAQPLSALPTGRPSLPPSFSTCRPLGSLLTAGLPRREDNGFATFHGCIKGGVGSASPPVARMATAGDGMSLCTRPRTFWFKLVSAFGLLDLTTFISSSLELAANRQRIFAFSDNASLRVGQARTTAHCFALCQS